MLRQDFTYELPQELIAYQPMPERSSSRLLYLRGQDGALEDKSFKDLLALLEPGDLLVFNDTRVIPARAFGKKASGGRVEILVERLLSQHEVLAHVKSSKSPREGTYIYLDDGTAIKVNGRDGALFKLEFEGSATVMDVLNDVGHMPLPPYIQREDEQSDRERYQTVYGQKPGAVAAPTAGLHFDEALLQTIKEKGVHTAFVTLHVGAGTFQPVRADSIKDHQMHSEWMSISPEVCSLIQTTKSAGKRVVAVGTTSVRCLETAASVSVANANSQINAYEGDTDIFIYPGYQFKIVDALITNFHLPESTLLMLVSAFAGYHHTLAAYKHAVAQSYRFFSYGDAMFITKNPSQSIRSEVPSAAAED